MAFTPSAIEEIARFPRIKLGHYPTPIEPLPRLSDQFPDHDISVKRDDCTGLGLGGNKVRQIEFYLGDALAKGCDTVLSTGAVQSNYMRTIAAAAARLGLECHIQLEHRVDNPSPQYRNSGNRMLTDLFGAGISYCPQGWDEDDADRSIRALAADLERKGKKPYVIPLIAVGEPRGALGYMVAAEELLRQFEDVGSAPDVIIVGSGSGLTHAGLLMGMRLLGSDVPVIGACVRRNAALQAERIRTHCDHLSDMLKLSNVIRDGDIWLEDKTLAPGYGLVSNLVRDAVRQAAALEGLLVDPVYSGKTLACLVEMIKNDALFDYRKILFLHTGGTPALFAYEKEIQLSPAAGPGHVQSG